MYIILYVLDSLRTDHLSCYGYQRNTSPNIDKLSKDGIIFKNAFAQSTWTKPSAASILSSLYPSVHKVEYFESYFDKKLLRLPDFLKNLGYKNYAISAMGQVSTPMGFNKNFDIFIDLYKENKITYKEKIKNKNVEEILKLEEVSLPLSEDINRYIFPYFDIDSKDKFFFIWSIDTHVPYNPPKEFNKFLDPSYEGKITGKENDLKRIHGDKDKKRIIDLYDCEIYYNDFQIGVLIEELKNKKLYDDSLIVITGDHGESFRFEEANVGHGHIPFDDLIKIPLIIKFPKSLYRGREVTEIVQHIDIMPTILSFLGIDYKNLDCIQGQNIIDLLEKKIPINKYTYSETRQSRLKNTYFSVRSDYMKYILKKNDNGIVSVINELKLDTVKKIIRNPIYFLRRRYSGNSEMLFDLKSDISEKVNLFEKKVKNNELKRILDIYLENNKKAEKKLERINEDVLVEKINMDKYIKNQLKKLGYF